MADQYVPVPGGSNNNNYANIELILDIAKRTEVQVNGTTGQEIYGSSLFASIGILTSSAKVCLQEAYVCNSSSPYDMYMIQMILPVLSSESLQVKTCCRLRRIMSWTTAKSLISTLRLSTIYTEDTQRTRGFYM